MSLNCIILTPKFASLLDSLPFYLLFFFGRLLNYVPSTFRRTPPRSLNPTSHSARSEFTLYSVHPSEILAVWASLRLLLPLFLFFIPHAFFLDPGYRVEDQVVQKAPSPTFGAGCLFPYRSWTTLSRPSMRAKGIW